jgi:integrase
MAVLKPGKKAIEKLRRWIKSLSGLKVGKAVGLDPNHAWRHRFKTKARDAQIDSTVMDAICGHAPATVGAGYGRVSVKAMAVALAKIP